MFLLYAALALMALAVASSVLAAVSRSLARRGRFRAAHRLGTAGFCAAVLVTTALAALASLTASPYVAAGAAVLLLLSILDYRFLERLPREDRPTDKTADGSAAPQNGGI